MRETGGNFFATFLKNCNEASKFCYFRSVARGLERGSRQSLASLLANWRRLHSLRGHAIAIAPQRPVKH